MILNLYFYINYYNILTICNKISLISYLFLSERIIKKTYEFLDKTYWSDYKVILIFCALFCD